MDSNFNLRESIKLDISEEFEELKKAFSCGKCNNLIVRPVILNTCGHIQCELCLDNKKLKCSVCRASYNEIDVTESSITDSVIKCIRNIENIGKVPKATDQKEDILLAKHQKKQKNPFNNEFEIVIVLTPMKKNHKGETPLHLACKKGKLDKVKELISSGVDINATDWGNWSPLHEAVHGRQYECVKELLDNRALINIPGDNYMTPLHEAVCDNADHITELLLKYGAANELDSTGRIPFDYISDNIKLTNLKCINSSSVYIPKVFVNKDITVYAQNLSRDKITLLHKQGVKFITWVDYTQKDCVTHLVITENKLNVSLLIGILKGIFVVNKEWANLIPLEILPFEQIPQDYTSTIMKSIKNKLERKPKLFSGINFHIFHHDSKTRVHNIYLTKIELSLLIEVGGGKVVTRSPALRTVENSMFKPYHARNSQNLECCNYIIYDEQKEPVLMYNMKELQHKSSKWLIDCILQFRILD